QIQLQVRVVQWQGKWRLVQVVQQGVESGKLEICAAGKRVVFVLGIERQLEFAERGLCTVQRNVQGGPRGGIGLGKSGVQLQGAACGIQLQRAGRVLQGQAQ